MKKNILGKLVIVVLITALLAIILFLFKLYRPSDILSQLQSQYGNIEIIDATFQGHVSQKATVRADNKTILLQVVRKVEQNSLVNVMAELEKQVTGIGENLVYFDPYKGEQVNYSVPDEFKPIKEEILLRGANVKYYIVYANEIFSYFVFSKEKAKFRGIVSVFSCQDNVYKIDIFSEAVSFDRGALVHELEKFYCL